MATISARSLNLADGFDFHLEQDPSATCLVIGDQSWTRHQIADLSERAVTMLLDAGVQPGQRVIVQYDTSLEDVALAIAVARIGATMIPVPKRLGVREINFLLERSSAALFCHVGDRPPEGVSPPEGAKVAASSGVHAFAPSSIATAATAADHCALVGVTSGSTGQPKGVMVGWTAVSWAAERMRALVDVQPGEAVLVTGAGAGAPGFTFFTYLPLVTGATIVKAAKWDPVQVVQLAEQHRCVWSCMVTTMLRMLIEARPAALGDRRLTSMRAFTVGGGFMSEELIEQARSELGVEVLRMYAMAECMANASTALEDSVAVRNLLDGKPGPEAELAVFDDDRKRLPPGATGEIGLKGPSLLQGYLGDPSGKASLMTPDGFFLSGDIGRIDEQGYVKVVGRKKDMINRGGYKIDPSEVEDLICKHPDVAKVAVVGYPDPLFGERACAVVEPHPSCSVDTAAIIRFLLEQGLSKEKLPERFEWRDALPLSPDGKILKAAVKAEIGTDPTAGLT